ncbi:UNVERIFIED_ORG: hypothetical protein GGD48_006507 [Rhizobium etli]
MMSANKGKCTCLMDGDAVRAVRQLNLSLVNL